MFGQWHDIVVQVVRVVLTALLGALGDGLLGGPVGSVGYHVGVALGVQ